MSTQTKNIGLFGYGVVGQGFYDFVQREGNSSRIPLVVVKSATKKRPDSVVNYTTDGTELLSNEEPSIIIEAINNTQDAFEIVSTALKNGKQVISASKKLLAEKLQELIELERQYGGTLLYEPAVAGSVPVIRILNDFYKQEEITSIKGIVNGSSNFILSKLFETNVSYDQALKEAQENGFAELDPTTDVGGYDALHKLVLLTLQGYGKIVKPDEILRVGIQNITKSDIELAKSNGLIIKQIAEVRKVNNQLELSVRPVFVENKEELALVNQEYNAVVVHSKTVGNQLYKGKGAGSFPTGSAVFADLKAIDNGYRYRYKKSDLTINTNRTLEFLVRLPQSYNANTLPFKTELISRLEDRLFYVRANETEIRNEITTIENQGISLLFFDSEDIKNKILGKIKEVTPTEFKLLQEKGVKVQLIDVREKWEFEHANIGGELIPLGELEEHLNLINKDQQVVVLCRSGKRSASAIDILQRKYNFKNLYNLKGGILAWADEIDATIEKY